MTAARLHVSSLGSQRSAPPDHRPRTTHAASGHRRNCATSATHHFAFLAGMVLRPPGHSLCCGSQLPPAREANGDVAAMNGLLFVRGGLSVFGGEVVARWLARTQQRTQLALVYHRGADAPNAVRAWARYRLVPAQSTASSKRCVDRQEIDQKRHRRTAATHDGQGSSPKPRQ